MRGGHKKDGSSGNVAESLSWKALLTQNIGFQA